MAKLVQLKDKDGNVYPEVYGLVYTEVVQVATNINVPANNQPATQIYTLSPRTGYTPIMACLNNTWGSRVILFYCNLDGNSLRWRVGNPTSTAVTNFNIFVSVLYIKTSCIAT